jgi:hypothetical protein
MPRSPRGRLTVPGLPNVRDVGAPGAFAPRQPATIRPWQIPGRMILSAPEVPCSVVGRPDGPWQLSTRSGKWEVIDRQGYRPVSAWQGYNLLRITGRLLLDAWLTEDGDVIEELRALSRMERKVDDDQIRRPPYLDVVGVLPVLPEASEPPRWVIETYEPEELLHRPDGRCARAVAALTLLEFSDPDVAIQADAKATARTIGTTYRWKSGDTLHGVAKRQLGDERKTDAIRQANPAIKAFSKLSPGDPVQIPPRASA